MKKVKKLGALLLVMCMVVCSLVGCGSSNNNNSNTKNSGKDDKKSSDATPEKMTLKVWAPQEDLNANGDYKKGIITYMCDQFNKAHPEWDITFDIKPVGESDAPGEIQKDASTAADVFMFVSDQIGKLVDAKVLYPINTTADELKKTQEDAAVDAVTYDGKLYGFPFTPNSWFLYYNKSMLTAEDVKSVEGILNKKTPDGVSNFAIDFDNSFYISAFFFANGCTLFGEDGTDSTSVDFNNEKGLAVGNYLTELVRNKKFMDIADGNDKALLKKGKLAAACSGTWDAGLMKEALGDNYAAAKLPTIKVDGKDVQLASFKAYKLIGVNSQTKNPKAAMALAEYLSGKECQQIRLDARAIAPTVKEIADSLGDDADPAVLAMNEQSQFSVIQPNIPQMDNYWTPAQAFAADVLNKKITKSNMQSKLDDMVKNMLATTK